MKSKARSCAVVDIGSKNVKMGIFEHTKGVVKSIDKLSYPVSLGHEIFNFGYVKFSSLNELNNILSKFKTACEGYGIENMHVVSTTVMREAKNADIIADRIKIKNGINVSTLADSEEKSLIYSQIIKDLTEKNHKIGKAIIAYIGSGSIGLACFDGKNITNSCYITVGSLKLHDLLGDLRHQTTDYHLVVEEYLFMMFNKLNIDFSSFSTLILTGSELRNVKNLTSNSDDEEISFMKFSVLSNFYKSIKSITNENISLKYNFSEETANVFSTTLSISYVLATFLGADAKLVIAPVDILKIIATNKLVISSNSYYTKHITESSYESAKLLALKFRCNPVHYEAVRRISSQLFNKLKNVHGLGKEHKHFLELATILHSCGEYLNTRQKTISTYDLIKNMDIYGISRQKINLIAIIASYNEFDTHMFDMFFESISAEDKMMVMKLTAIIRLANALDKSHKNKIAIDRLKLDDNELYIYASAKSNPLLEQWAFKESSDYFMELFGIRPMLVIKSSLLNNN